MSVSWEHAYRACEPAAAEVVRALAVLRLEAVSSPAVGVAVGLTAGETEAAVGQLWKAGWLTGRHAVVERARAWLVANATELVEPARAVEIVRAFTAYHAEAVREVDGWLDPHRAEVLAAVRAGDRPGARGPGIRLVRQVWATSGRVRDPGWWQDLATAGEALAIADHDPGALVELLHRSATGFAGQGDRLSAEARWVRAVAIVRRAGDDVDRDLAGTIMTALGDLYRQWGRLGKALDADLGWLGLSRSAGDRAGTVRALARVAATMHAAGRAGSAADYYGQADEAMIPDATPEFHARILVRWGRALWDDGQPGQARRRWSRALAMMIDVDDDAADHIRVLLATAPEDPLPVDPQDDVPNTSPSSSGGIG